MRTLSAVSWQHSVNKSYSLLVISESLLWTMKQKQVVGGPRILHLYASVHIIVSITFFTCLMLILLISLPFFGAFTVLLSITIHCILALHPSVTVHPYWLCICLATRNAPFVPAFVSKSSCLQSPSSIPEIYLQA